MQNASKNMKITQVITPTAGAAAQTAIEGTEIDMAGYESVMFIVMMGTIDATAVTSIKAQQDTASGMASAADLEGTSQTIAADDDDEIFYIDLVKPQERFVRV